jgi:plasmid stabilization system protein ParE
MAHRTIVWSHKAKIKRYEILKYYIDRNKSKTYSVKLNERINKEIRLLVDFPNKGVKTELENIRCLIIEHFIIFYEITEKQIIIHHIWDTRQNPDILKIK